MKSNTKRAIAVAVFNSGLASLPVLGAREFRKRMLAEIAVKTDSLSSAASMYNYAKKLAVQAGAVAEFGRAAKVEPVAEVVEPVVEDTNAWAVVDADGNEVGTYASRGKARAAKGEGQRVVQR